VIPVHRVKKGLEVIPVFKELLVLRVRQGRTD
jgi:hypothetical protein